MIDKNQSTPTISKRIGYSPQVDTLICSLILSVRPITKQSAVSTTNINQLSIKIFTHTPFYSSKSHNNLTESALNPDIDNVKII